MVRNLQAISEFGEEKVTEWLRGFEKKVLEFELCPEKWVGLVANRLKGKALEAYHKMRVEDMNYERL